MKKLLLVLFVSAFSLSMAKAQVYPIEQLSNGYYFENERSFSISMYYLGDRLYYTYSLNDLEANDHEVIGLYFELWDGDISVPQYSYQTGNTISGYIQLPSGFNTSGNYYYIDINLKILYSDNYTVNGIEDISMWYPESSGE